MVVYLAFIATLLTLSNAELTRNLGVFGGDYVQNKIDKICPELSSECPNIVEGDCTFEKPSEQPNFFEMTKEEIEDLKAQRKERKEQMFLCICCGELDLEDKGYGKGDGEKYYKGYVKGYNNGGDGKGDGKGGDKGYDKESNGKEYDWGYDKGYGYGKGYGTEYGKGNDKGYGKGVGKSPADIQAKLDQKCPKFDCDWVDPLEVDCTHFDTKMNSGGDKNRLLRGKGNGKNFLYCGCCRNDEDSYYYSF